MSLKEYRQNFESTLKEKLQENFSHLPQFKILKDTLKVVTNYEKDVKFKDSYIAFPYAHESYTIRLNIKHPHLTDFVNRLNPPYGISSTGRILPHLFFSSLSIRDDYFTPVENLGMLLLPLTQEDLDETIAYIIHKLKEVFIPKSISYIDIKPNLVDDVIKRRIDYNYPIITIIFALKKNNLPLTPSLKAILMQDIFHKDIQHPWIRSDEKSYLEDLNFNKKLLDNFDIIEI